MSIDWFRWHHGAVADPKFTVVARKSGQPRAMVLAVWAALLEAASEADDRGSVADAEVDTIAACLDMDDDAVTAIVRAMTSKGLIVDGRIASWERRQVFREDDSSERVRKFREKQRDTQNVTQGNAPVTQGNAPVTPQSRADTDQNRAEQIQSRERERARKRANPARAPKTDFPAGLTITPELQAWATEHGYLENLQRHLDAFRDKATANGYRYSDWPAALRNAIRDDWAGLRKSQAAPGGGRAGGKVYTPATKHAALAEHNSDVLSQWLNQDATPSAATAFSHTELAHATH